MKGHPGISRHRNEKTATALALSVFLYVVYVSGWVDGWVDDTYTNVDDAAVVDIGCAKGFLWQLGQAHDLVAYDDQINNADLAIVIDISGAECAASRR